MYPSLDHHLELVVGYSPCLIVDLSGVNGVVIWAHTGVPGTCKSLED